MTGLVGWNLLLLLYWQVAEVPCPPNSVGLQDGQCIGGRRLGPFFRHFWAWGLVVGLALAAVVALMSRRPAHRS